jgi:AraC family transcriptional regulator of adaptative response/methylated-DNA-[protein]-cysteine methyltransferase
LRRAGTVSAAIPASGHRTAARFYAVASRDLGMTPRAFARGGEDLDIGYVIRPTPFGLLLVAKTARGICASSLGDRAETLRDELAALFPKARLSDAGPAEARLVDAVLASLVSPPRASDLPLDLRGTAFQQRVWRALRAVPAGETVTYTELAERVGCRDGARAVARACATNPAALVVPCHRVLRADGDLAGYRWGRDRKAEILAHERNHRS